MPRISNKLTRVCEWCDLRFRTIRSAARFCCDDHRYKWHKKEQRRLVERGREAEQPYTTWPTEE